MRFLLLAITAAMAQCQNQGFVTKTNELFSPGTNLAVYKNLPYEKTDLQGYWSFDSVMSATYGVGTAPAISGNGVPTAASAANRYGEATKAATFNIGTAPAPTVQYGGNDLNGSNNQTIAFWIQLKSDMSAVGSDTKVIQKDCTSTEGYAVLITTLNQLQIKVGDCTGGNTFTMSEKLTVGQWTFVAISWQNTAGVSLSMDVYTGNTTGTFKSLGTFTTVSAVNPIDTNASALLTIDVQNVLLDDLLVYYRTMKTSNIANLYLAGSFK